MADSAGESAAAGAPVNLVELFQNGENAIERRRTDNLFKQLDERQLTEDEQNIIQQRVDLQRKMFVEYERREKERKVRELNEVCPDLDEEAAKRALELCNWKEEEAAMRLSSDPAFLRRVTSGVCEEVAPAPKVNRARAGSTRAQVGPRPKLVDPSQVGAVFVGKFKGRLGPHQISAMGRQQAAAAKPASAPAAGRRGGASRGGAKTSRRKRASAADETDEEEEEEPVEESEGEEHAEPAAAGGEDAPMADAAAAVADDEGAQPMEEGEEAVADAEEEPNSADLSDNELRYEDDVLPVLSPLAVRRQQQEPLSGGAPAVVPLGAGACKTATTPVKAQPVAGDEDEVNSPRLLQPSSGNEAPPPEPLLQPPPHHQTAETREKLPSGADAKQQLEESRSPRAQRQQRREDRRRCSGGLAEAAAVASAPAAGEAEPSVPPAEGGRGGRTRRAAAAVAVLRAREAAGAESEKEEGTDGASSDFEEEAAAKAEASSSDSGSDADVETEDSDCVAGGRGRKRRAGVTAKGKQARKRPSRGARAGSSEPPATVAADPAAAGPSGRQAADVLAGGEQQDSEATVTEDEGTKKPAKGKGAAKGRGGRGGGGGGRGRGAISASGHTCRGRVKQKGVKRADLLSVGQLIARPGWFNAGYIFPAGFRAQTLFRSSVDLDSLTMHTCEIVGEGGAYWPAPTYVVTAADRPDEPLVAKSCTGCWTAVLKRINGEIEGRRAAGENLPPPPKTAIAGPEYFGLNQPEICAAIEALDADKACAIYWDGKMDREAIRGGAPLPVPRAAPAAPKVSRAPRNSTGGGGGRKRGGKGRGSGDDEPEPAPEGEEDPAETYAGNRWSAVTRGERYRKRCEDAGEDMATMLEESARDNPLPGFLDPITLEPVSNPAISPFGHVMGFATWKAVLAEHGRCPFTKQQLKAEQLTVLTKNNIERYRSKIIQS
ncbi:hypothetical protein HYH03_012719 [Edaphochlamys debaryana]|uniref:U-box domain-containing protein n=1 Tax=Edaphochlamys debaryana TaxID=47281 RepID=A0A835Y016_9CHLO|nr:hypothetical protein HYH03_012719 [Edaphochlamys debaryana]|eukprot:KAG2488719.1 hypothetical protein HYH03_012719 [Edaphochlamys debaryana]